jgi:hypothetical protein
MAALAVREFRDTAAPAARAKDIHKKANLK